MQFKTKNTRSKDGAKIVYKVNRFENGPFVVFLHGLGGGLNVWEREIQHFHKNGVSTIAIDLRGHGLSDRSSTDGFYKIENFINDVESVLENESPKSYSIVGHSLGGMLGLGVASKKPIGLKNIVLIDAVYKSPSSKIDKYQHPMLNSFLNFFIKTLPDIKTSGRENYKKFIGTGDFNILRSVDDILHVSLRDYFLICKQLLGEDEARILNRVTVPTLIIQGESDKLVKKDVAYKLKRLIKKSELKLIKNEDHLLILNDVKDIVREIDNFFVKHKFI